MYAQAWPNSSPASSVHTSSCTSNPLSASAESRSVSNNFDLYIDASKSVREVLMQVCPGQTALLTSQYDENLMMASLDEGYLK